MKRSIIFCLSIIFSLTIHAQEMDSPEKEAVKKVIDKFFTSLETRDSVLMMETTLNEAQVWRYYVNEFPAKYNVRLNGDDIPIMYSLPNMREMALAYTIEEKDGIASAWVPYKLYIEGRFVHCGVDVFTLFYINGSWKIVTMAYSIDKENCGETEEE